MATKQQKSYAIGAAVAIVGLGLFLSRKRKQPLFITSGGTFDGVPSQLLQLRLPQGTYSMMGGEGLHLLSQSPRGDMQDLQILIKSSEMPFTVTPTFIDETNDQNQHTITVNVKPPGT